MVMRDSTEDPTRARKYRINKTKMIVRAEASDPFDCAQGGL
jgi:hypothetical protein